MAHQDLAAELKVNRTFTYSSHGGHISADMRHNYEKRLLLDILLVAGIEEVEIGAHWIVLSESSKVLREKFNGEDEILLENLEGTSLKLIVDSLYSGSIQLNIDSVDGVLSAANFLEMDSLARVCRNYIGEQLDSSNCLGVALYAEHHGYTVLHELARTFTLEHFEKVYTEKEFLQLTESQLKQFLSSDDVSKVSQRTLFHSLVAWIGHDPEQREKLTYSVLNLVNYKLLDHDFIVTNKESVLKSNECTELIDSWLKWHSKAS